MHVPPDLLPLSFVTPSSAIGHGDVTISLPTNISKWRTSHAQAWLAHTMELPQYVDAFKAASIDGPLLVTYMTGERLEEIIGTV